VRGAGRPGPLTIARPLSVALLTLGIAFGLVAEWASYDAEGLDLAVADFAVGFVLIACGAVAWERRPESHVGALMSLAGFAWFLGTFWASALFLHRGPLVHLVLSYPSGRVRTRLAQGVVVVAYVDAVVAPLGRNGSLTLALAVAVVIAALLQFRGTSGPARRAQSTALVAALAFAGVLALGAITRLAGYESDRAVLWTYDVVIASLAIMLSIDLLRSRWAEAVMTGLVVDLGAGEEAGTVRAKLARALGDPSLVVGYRLPDTDGLVDDAGRPVELPPPGSERAVTTIDAGGEQIAVLVHDQGLLGDRRLLESVAAAARIAMTNARLQAEVRSRAADLEASRRRIVEAGDAQRRRLEEELRQSAERRLAHVAELLAGADPELERGLADARAELREFAQGIHPVALTEGGLHPALAELAARSPVPVELSAPAVRFPPVVEAAAYFVCSEALANVAKYAQASRVTVRMAETGGRLRIDVLDDGIGGANPSSGSGLRGLADRVSALGGQLAVESPPGSGTRIVAELPGDL
jgi:signal transduction histidine kinase